MLDKLVGLEKVHKYMDSLEFWMDELEDAEEYYAVTPLVKSLVLRNDSYIHFLMGLNKSNNIHLEAVRLLLNNREDMGAKFSKQSNSAAVEFVRRIPYAMVELFKLCSRLFVFEDSDESLEIRKLTLSDANYATENNTRVMLSATRNSTNLIMSVEETQDFWTYVDDFAKSEGTYNHDVLCKDWKAADDEDFLSRHVLLYCENFTQDSSINGTFREMCRTCSSYCGSTSRIHVDWYVEKFTLDPVADLVYSTGLLISVALLLVTLLVYCLLPRLHRPVHGRCTVFHLVSMVTAYTFICIPQLRQDLYKTHPTLCVLNGYVVQYGFLAMFFWLNIMCFDILFAFRCLAKTRNVRKVEGSEGSKVLRYCCYGWGGPGVILALTVIVENSDLLDPRHVLKPNLGGPKCFFQNVESQWMYLYGPIGCLILSNLIMFAITAFEINDHSKDSEMLKSPDNAAFNKGNNNRLKVYVNLFILMGANWAAEILSWLLPEKQVIKYLLDVTTTLQGVLVFALLVCKPRVLRELRSKLCGVPSPRNNVTPLQMSLSSNKSSGQTAAK